jgi:uncharacterized protein (DUF488 family)
LQGVSKSSKTIFTIGHSTRTLDELVELLRAHGVRAVADVRQIPKSRRLPHFNAESLAVELPLNRIEYHPFKEIGGRRHARRDSPNTGWRNESFRGYADFMQTPQFLAGLTRLMELARHIPTATMCAEAVPWRCHRSLIADALTARGVEVRHVMTREKADLHKMTEFAVVEGTNLWYPEGGQLRLL